MPNSAEKLVSTASPKNEREIKKKKNKPKTEGIKKCCKNMRHVCTQKEADTIKFSTGKKDMAANETSPATMPIKKAVKVPDVSFEKTEYNKNAAGIIKASRKIISSTLS